jgi:hypothetical protein
VTERKTINKHLLKQASYICKGGKVRKSDGKKDMQYAFIRSRGGYSKLRRQWTEKGREGEESDGKKDGQYAFIKIRAARFQCGVKIGGKRERRAREVTERKMGNKHLLEAGKLYM